MARRTKAARTARKAAPASSQGRPSIEGAREQARGHSSTRAAHARETAEDYAETIADLIARRGEARVTEIAACLGVSHVTVVRTIARLSREGLVVSRPYRSIFLTDQGRALAEESARRHRIVVDFLLALGVPRDAASADAEGIEHHVGPHTLQAFERFVRKRAKPGDQNPRS